VDAATMHMEWNDMNAASTPYDRGLTRHPRRRTWGWRGGWGGYPFSAAACRGRRAAATPAPGAVRRGPAATGSGRAAWHSGGVAAAAMRHERARWGAGRRISGHGSVSGQRRSTSNHRQHRRMRG